MSILVVVGSIYTRDIQVFKGDGWKDAFGEVVLGVYKGRDEKDILCKASLESDIPVDYLKGYVLR